MTTLQEFAHLWDGSEPGWVLVRMNSQVMTLAVRFATAGPTLKDIAALRSAVSAFGEMRPSEAFAALKGRVEVSLGTFESKQGRRLAGKCREHGLTVEEQTMDQSHYLHVNEQTNVCLIIEDDAVAKQVYEESLARGLPVRHTEA